MQQPDMTLLMADQIVRLVVLYTLQAVVYTAIATTAYLLVRPKAKK